MDCKTCYDYYYCFIEKDFAAIPPEQLKHLRSCPACREATERLSASLESPGETHVHSYLALHFGLLEQPADCETIKPFLPCLAMAALPLHCRTPVTAHLEACPACRADYEAVRSLELSDAQLLRACRFLMNDDAAAEGFSEQARHALTAVRQRAASGVVTCAGLSGDQTESLPAEEAHPAVTRTALRPRHRLRIAASGLAAAVVLAATILFVAAPPAGALDLHQFYAALAGAQNLSIQTFVPEEDEPVQHIWIMQPNGIGLFESSEKTVLYDLNAKTAAMRLKTSPDVKIRNFTSAPESLQLPWGLLPFRDVTQIPPGFQWQRSDAHSEGQNVVYELFWSEPLSGERTIAKKWVGHINRSTHLPERIEWYERFGDQLTYSLSMTTLITYPSAEQVFEAIQRSGY